MTENHEQGHVVPIPVYLGTFAALMVLLVLTLAVAPLRLGTAVNTAIAMSIAVAKATLVVLYFMHVRYSSKLVWLWAGIGFLWLVILFVITMSDYLTRFTIQGW